MALKVLDNSLALTDKKLIYNERVILSENEKSPLAFLGYGDQNMNMQGSNYSFEDKLTSKLPLVIGSITELEDAYNINLTFENTNHLELKCYLDNEGRLIVEPHILKKGNWNRLWLRIVADSEEKIYGCGEQLTYLNLRKHVFPIWTSNTGVGRNKKKLVTMQADLEENAGGDYYTTSFPQATFISSHKYYCHIDDYSFVTFDFTNEQFHELLFWSVPKRLIFETSTTYKRLLGKMTKLLGRQNVLPSWTDNGIILGLTGGIKRVQQVEKKLKAGGVNIAAILCHDVNEKSQEKYSNLAEMIQQWNKEDMKYLGYITPYIAKNSPNYLKLSGKQMFVKNKAGKDYTVLISHQQFVLIDLTNPMAFMWLKDEIKNKLLAIGASGWIADGGENLPADGIVFENKQAFELHNYWPVLWAKCNLQAIEETRKEAEIVYFMKAGSAQSAYYSPVLWQGMQSVDWSQDDGLASAICAALSSGMSGMGISQSDIGGNLSSYGNMRTAELLARWTEFACFSPFMRMQETNRPAVNFQAYDNNIAIEHLAKFSNIFKDLSRYRQEVIKQVTLEGLPAMRPLFIEYEKDEEAYKQRYEYLFGTDLLIAPVYRAGKKEWQVYLPDDNWIHIWSGRKYKTGYHTISAQIGEIPVFYRAYSKFSEQFEKIGNQYSKGWIQ